MGMKSLNPYLSRESDMQIQSVQRASPAMALHIRIEMGTQAKVFLAGVSKGASEQVIKLAVRDAVEAATDFSWLSKGDAVFIKPVNNSGNPNPATTCPTAIAATVEILKEKGAGRVIVGDMSGVQYLRFSPTVFEPDYGLIIASGSVVAHDMVSLAWLLENRSLIPASKRDGCIDTSIVVPRNANRMVTGWLGGWGPALASETMTKNNISTIWDDRVLTRSYDLFGGVPAVLLESANKALPVARKTAWSIRSLANCFSMNLWSG